MDPVPGFRVGEDVDEGKNLRKSGRLVPETALEAPKPVFPRYVAPEATA